MFFLLSFCRMQNEKPQSNALRLSLYGEKMKQSK